MVRLCGGGRHVATWSFNQLTFAHARPPGHSRFALIGTQDSVLRPPLQPTHTHTRLRPRPTLTPTLPQ